MSDKFSRPWDDYGDDYGNAGEGARGRGLKKK